MTSTETVWILTSGEDNEGGFTDGVYAEKALAFADFLAATRAIGARFGLDNVRQHPDGTVWAHGGCDWVQLTPHAVVQRAAIEGDPIADVAALLAH